MFASKTPRTALKRLAKKTASRPWPGATRFLSSPTAAATATATAEVPASSHSVHHVTKEPGVPNPDPSEGSSTAAWIAKHASYKVATYAQPPIVLTKGKGSYVWDMEGRKYLDMMGGIAVNSLGHSDPEVAKILFEQAQTMIHCSNLYYNPWADALAELLVDATKASGGMHDAAAAFLCNSGTEANEAGFKFARKVGRVLDPSGAKHEIVSFAGAFHGRTMGSLSATPNAKYQAPFAPLVPGFRTGEFNNADARVLAELITERTCGVVVEPVQGEGGVRPATDEFLVAVARRCREVGAVLHHDEIQSGLGRTGALWAHARLPREAHPDVLTTAKGIANGFPLGAVLVSRGVADKMAVGDHGTTFGGNPLACRLAHHVVSRLAAPAMLEAVAARGAVLTRGLAQLAARHPGLATEIRGRGLLIGWQLTEDPSKIVAAARERGLLVITAGTNTLRFVPSLTISEAEIVEGLGILGEAIEATRG